MFLQEIHVKGPLFTNKEADNRGILRCCNRPILKLQLSDMLTFQTLSVAGDKSKYLSDVDYNFAIQNNYNRIAHKQLASIMFNCDQYQESSC